MFGNLLEKIRYLRDKRFVSKVYSETYGRPLDWENPKRYSEKLNIFKISKDSEKYSDYVDKFKVREYVKEAIGEEYLMPMVGLYENTDQIDILSLPTKFILKCTHSSGATVICQDKSQFNWDHEKVQLDKWLNSNFYFTSRERQYKNIIPRIICEEYLDDGSGGLSDYKFHCFNGKVAFIRGVTDQLSGIKRCTYNPNWEHLPFTLYHDQEEGHDIIPKPINLKEMIKIAEKLAKPFPHVRVDLYNHKGKIYFGELTFTPVAGLFHINPDKYDLEYGAKYNLVYSTHEFLGK
jgi:hypothetical protein